MPLTKEEFEVLKSHQYCDNRDRRKYGLVGEVLQDLEDRWTFVAILPDSSFIHTVHSPGRNLQEATEFVGQIKANSDGEAPLFASDDWFYQKALLTHYGFDHLPPYAGRGRRPHLKRLPLPDLTYLQVQKKRDEKGRLLEIKYAIVYGIPPNGGASILNAVRCK